MVAVCCVGFKCCLYAEVREERVSMSVENFFAVKVLLFSLFLGDCSGF